MKLILTFSLVFLLVGTAQAKLVTRAVEYKQNATVLKGYLAYDDAVKGKRPGVLVVHEFWGLNDFAKKRTEQLAQMGYVSFAADMYGQGRVTRDFEQASKWAGELRGTPLIRERAQAALKVLAGQELVDLQRLAAIGFCFGGTTVLELAYSGADLAGVVSFHGGLPLPRPEDAGRLKAKILVLHGADDPHVPRKDVDQFWEAMRQAGADWQMIIYGGAVHSFTNPEAGGDKSKGAAYDAKAAARSWRHLEVFFEEIFSRQRGKNP
jgi:dienelactone hydrolase